LAYEAVKFAQNNAKTELEKEIANALAKRYIHRPYEESFRATDINTENVKCVDKQNNKVNASSKQEKMCVDAPAYARAMKKLYNDKDLSPENKFDVATLYAAAEMNINPWQWWNKDKPTEQIVNALEALTKVLYDSPEKVQELLQIKSFKGDSLAENEVHRCKLGDDQIPKPKSDHIGANHLGANHYFIHATEESPCPKVALPSADRIKEQPSLKGRRRYFQES
jgi:hypothetical protein